MTDNGWQYIEDPTVLLAELTRSAIKELRERVTTLEAEVAELRKAVRGVEDSSRSR